MQIHHLAWINICNILQMQFNDSACSISSPVNDVSMIGSWVDSCLDWMGLEPRCIVEGDWMEDRKSLSSLIASSEGCCKSPYWQQVCQALNSFLKTRPNNGVSIHDFRLAIEQDVRKPLKDNAKYAQNIDT